MIRRTSMSQRTRIALSSNEVGTSSSRVPSRVSEMESRRMSWTFGRKFLEGCCEDDSVLDLPIGGGVSLSRVRELLPTPDDDDDS